MKKYASVFGLFAKSSILKILIIAAVMAAAQFVLFASELGRSIEVYEAGLDFPHLEAIIDRSHIAWVFGGAFIAISVSICLIGTSFSSKTGYTLDRLSISPRSIFFCQAIYDLAVYLIFWAVELTVCLGLCQYYLNLAPAALTSHQSGFLAFYRNSFLHPLLPLADIAVWIRNAFLLIALAIATAEYPYKQRRRRLGISAFAMVLFTVVFFKTETANSFNTILIIVVSIINVIEMCYNFFSEDNSYEKQA